MAVVEYDRNGMCAECGGKAGEHGPSCNAGLELTRETVAIQLDSERRQQINRYSYAVTHERRCSHCGDRYSYTENPLCRSCDEIADSFSLDEKLN